jgi:hypothetical protein
VRYRSAIRPSVVEPEHAVDRRLELRGLRTRRGECGARENVEVVLPSGQLVHTDRSRLDVRGELRRNTRGRRAAEVEAGEGPVGRGVD